MEYVTLLLRWLHVIPAIAMVGGLIYMRFVLPKSLVDGTDAQFAELRGRWAKIVMLSTLLLLVTGITNMVLNGKMFSYGDDGSMSKIYNMVAGMKFLLALPIFFFAARLSGKSESAARLRASSSTLYLNITLGLAIVIVMIGGFLRGLPREPKAADESAQVMVGEDFIAMQSIYQD